MQPIWTITVTAKLDQSGVLVTKFRQNRSTLKGRSAGLRQTDRHTDRQTGLKIRALQVCNRANKKAVLSHGTTARCGALVQKAWHLILGQCSE